MKRVRRWISWSMAGCLVAASAIAGEIAAVTIAFVGDVMLADSPGEVILSGRDPLAAFEKLLDASDIRIANLECVVSDKGQADPDKPYSFRAHPRSLEVLRRHFDAVSLANNHSGDYGAIAFSDMLDRLEHADIPYFGGGRNLEAAHAPLILERKGLRFALLGYNEFLPRWFEADYDRSGIAWSEDEQVKLDIENARRVFHADIVVPFMHWGWEHEKLASDRQRHLAHLMIDAGADAVIGGHPHVVQDIEIYRGKPVIYSLGNFVFDGFETAEATTGWLLALTIESPGVVAFRTTTARIDQEGIPRPDHGPEGHCWRAGLTHPMPCDREPPADASESL